VLGFVTCFVVVEHSQPLVTRSFELVVARPAHAKPPAVSSTVCLLGVSQSCQQTAEPKLKQVQGKN
jgi:hypothetical protein